MRFRAQKIREEQRDWSVILNPLKSEIDRKRVAEKISDLFRLSFEEARELVQSTPVILLDELSRPVAQQAQNLFQEARADITLSNDALVKRRCYRAVWPEPPSLSFLNSASSESGVSAVEGAPVGTVVETEPAPLPEPPMGAELAPPLPVPSELENKLKEFEKLYEEKNRECQELRQTLDRDIPWEERFNHLKEEYEETKSILEEKILAREREFEPLKGQIKELSGWQERAASLERQIEEIMKRLKEGEAERTQLRQGAKEQMEELASWREKYHTVAQKSERFESLYEEERKRREKAEESWRESSAAADQSGRNLELQRQEAERWLRRTQELEENQKRLEREMLQLSEESQAELKRLRDENREISTQLESAQRQVKEFMFRMEQQELIERRTRLANDLGAKEARLRELILEGDHLRQEIQDRELQAQSLSNEQANLEREILEVKQAQRHILEQGKMKDKLGRLKRPGADPV